MNGNTEPMKCKMNNQEIMDDDLVETIDVKEIDDDDDMDVANVQNNPIENEEEESEKIIEKQLTNLIEKQENKNDDGIGDIDDYKNLKTIIIPQLPRCDTCTLRGGCNHHTFNEALEYLKNEIKSYPQNPTKEVCYNFVNTGSCQSFQKHKYCNFHHPYELVVFPKKMRMAELRCPVCTIPNCTSHVEAKQMRNRQRRQNRKNRRRKNNTTGSSSLSSKNQQRTTVVDDFKINDTETNDTSSPEINLFKKKAKRKSGFMRHNEKLQRKRYEDTRCLICTLKLPCKHFEGDHISRLLACTCWCCNENDDDDRAKDDNTRNNIIIS